MVITKRAFIGQTILQAAFLLQIKPEAEPFLADSLAEGVKWALTEIFLLRGDLSAATPAGGGDSSTHKRLVIR